jgi:hypothetical protein
MTPSRLPNRESAPQNQPKENVAVSVCAGTAASMGGIVPFKAITSPFSACHGVHAATMTKAKGTPANIMYLKNVLTLSANPIIDKCYFTCKNTSLSIHYIDLVVCDFCLVLPNAKNQEFYSNPVQEASW